MAWGKKKEPNQQQAWLDWLNDDFSDGSPPETSPAAPSFRQHNGAAGLDGFVAPKTSSFNPASTRANRYHSAAPTSGTKPAKLGDTLRAERRVTTGTTLQPPAEQDIAINIHLPQLHIPRVTFHWEYLRWVVIVALGLALLFGGRLWLGSHQKQQSSDTKTTQAQLSFAPLKPTANSDSVNKNAVYDAQKQVYTFHDSYQGVNLVVSEQAIPAAVRDNPDTIKKAAAAIGASKSFDTASGTVYVATADTGGAQRLVLIHRQLLVFISSDGTLDTPTWVAYIQSLE